MNTLRDSFLGLETRKRNWLRLEHWRRVRTAGTILKRFLLRSLQRDAGLSRRQRGCVVSHQAQLSRTSLTTKHSTRCRVSGRVHGATRDVQLARLQMKQQMAEGRLLAFQLGRR